MVRVGVKWWGKEERPNSYPKGWWRERQKSPRSRSCPWLSVISTTPTAILSLTARPLGEDLLIGLGRVRWGVWVGGWN